MSLDSYGVLDAWRVEELTTQGWEVQDPKRDKFLTKENAKINFSWTSPTQRF